MHDGDDGSGDDDDGTGGAGGNDCIDILFCSRMGVNTRVIICHHQVVGSRPVYLP